MRLAPSPSALPALVLACSSALAFPTFLEDAEAGSPLQLSTSVRDPVKGTLDRAAVDNAAQQHEKRDPSAAAGCPFAKRSVAAQADHTQQKRDVDSIIDPAAFKFNAKAQHVSTTGDHEWQAPGPNDIRGPCPGLNVLSNHGYFPRNGVVDLLTAVEVVQEVYGISPELGGVLSAYATVMTGNVLDLSWSIGGPYDSTSLLGNLGQALGGRPGGINTHNIYEGDASVTRFDYYDPRTKDHDNVLTHLPFFEDLVKLGGNDTTPGKDVYTKEVLFEHRVQRFNDSIANNGNFFYSAFGGLVVTTAAHDFIVNFMSNNTAGENGFNRQYLDEANLFPFFAISRNKDGSLKYTPGHERFPENWYRRPIAAQFGLADVVANLLRNGLKDPRLLSVGGNAGKVNTFTGLNVGDLVGGVTNVGELLQNPTAFACFLYQATIEELIPSQLRVLYGGLLAPVLNLVNQYIAGPFKGLFGSYPCDNVKVDLSKANQFPGNMVPKPDGGVLNVLGSIL